MIPFSNFISYFAINGRGSLSPQLIGGLSIHGLDFVRTLGLQCQRIQNIVIKATNIFYESEVSLFPTFFFLVGSVDGLLVILYPYDRLTQG